MKNILLKTINLSCLTMVFMLFFATALQADVGLAPILSDGMVLQQEKPLSIWGQANKGEEITVTFGKSKVTTQADDEGKWIATLESQKANAVGQSLIVKGNNTIEIKDVLVGEVWFCGGQSNMKYELSKTTYGKDEVGKADYPNIRLCNSRGSWLRCSPESVKKFSAVAYFFGKNLHKKMNVPVGIILRAQNGTIIEPWIPLEGYKKLDSLKKYVDIINKNKGIKPIKGEPALPSSRFTGAIEPLTPFTLRGIVWYQGESNCIFPVEGEAVYGSYTDKMYAFVEGWREKFRQKDLSFYYVQIAPHRYSKCSYDKKKVLTINSLPMFWEAQLACLKKITNCGMVVISDLGKGLHPLNKRDVGYRLSLWALAKNYGKTDIVYSGPIYKSMNVNKNKISLEFDYVGTGLKSLDGKDLTYFQIAGKDKKFVAAKATIKGEKIIVESAEVASPVAVRFAWDEGASHNFGNKGDLPASPFRTDDWVMVP